MALSSARIATVVVMGFQLLGGCNRPPAAWIQIASKEPVEISELPALLSGYRVVIVGEHHALVEPVDTVKLLLDQSATEHCFTHLALEWPISDRQVIDRYFAGDDAILNRIQRRYAHLPGVTVELCSLFSFVREHNRGHPQHVIEIMLIDVPRPVRGTAEEARDKHMLAEIERVLAGSADSRILVHVGSAHAIKCGRLAYPSKTGQAVAMQPLAALMRSRHPDELVTVNVLSPVDPMWRELDRAGPFDRPVAFRLHGGWPESRQLFFHSSWQPDHASELPTADQEFDYAVWWPESRNGTFAK